MIPALHQTSWQAIQNPIHKPPSTIVLCRDPWSRLFTNDEQLVVLVKATLIPLSPYVIMDALQSALSGMIRGSGRQAVAAWVVIPSYWVLGMPLALVLGFKTSLGVRTILAWLCLLVVWVHTPCAWGVMLVGCCAVLMSPFGNIIQF